MPSIDAAARAIQVEEAISLDLTGSTLGIAALGIFVLAYGLVVSEEIIELRKSKPVVVAAGVIWVLVAIAYANAGERRKLHRPFAIIFWSSRR